MLMNYLATYSGGILVYHTSNMIINIDVYSSEIILNKSYTRAAYWFIFSTYPEKLPKTMTNAPFHVTYSTIKKFISSAAEANTGRIHIGGKCPFSMPTSAIEL